jgi:hypothetical protein
LLNEQFQAPAGIKMTHVPYRSAGQVARSIIEQVKASGGGR